MADDPVSYLKDSYKGCGHSKAKALINEFGSVQNIEDADIEHLIKVNSVGKSLAERISSGEKQDAQHFNYPDIGDIDTEAYRSEFNNLVEVGSEEDIKSLFEEVVENVCPDGKKQEQIGVLIELFGETPPAELIAKAASDADPIYVRRFSWDKEKRRVVLQENAAKRRTQQVDMVRRKQILNSYEACVGCGFDDRLYQCKIHHISPVDNEGSANDSNVVPVCPDCHSNLHDTGAHGDVIYSTEEEFWDWAKLTPQAIDDT